MGLTTYRNNEQKQVNIKMDVFVILWQDREWEGLLDITLVNFWSRHFVFLSNLLYSSLSSPLPQTQFG